MSINGRTFDHRPINELIAIVASDFRKLNAEGLIDPGSIVKHVMWCNDKLGIPIREIRQVAIPVVEFKAELPLDFEKLYYVCALQATNTMVSTNTNPFDNNVDRDIIYEAELDRESLGCVDNYRVMINRVTNTTVHTFGTWTQLDVADSSDKFCHIACPNRTKKGKYTITIKDGEIHTPFRAGMLYLMYIGMMKDEDGNILFPFHPMITPWYEWTIKYNIIIDAAFNSDINREEIEYFRKLAEKEKTMAWTDAFNFTLEKGYGEYTKLQRNRELSWYNTWFKHFT